MSRRKFTTLERAFIAERAYHYCEYCKFPSSYSHVPFHIEHILPIKLGGNNDMNNLAWACDGCNTNKWGFTEGFDKFTNEKVGLFNPRQDVWFIHFQWNKDLSSIIGKTPKGRATIELLQLNRDGLLNIRKALIAYGVFPKID